MRLQLFLNYWMGCQTEIAHKIVDQHADYMLAVKGNQGTLCEDIADLLAGFEQAHWQDVSHDYFKTLLDLKFESAGSSPNLNT